MLPGFAEMLAKVGVDPNTPMKMYVNVGLADSEDWPTCDEVWRAYDPTCHKYSHPMRVTELDLTGLVSFEKEQSHQLWLNGKVLWHIDREAYCGTMNVYLREHASGVNKHFVLDDQLKEMQPQGEVYLFGGLGYLA
jgi:hypothetical protein